MILSNVAKKVGLFATLLLNFIISNMVNLYIAPCGKGKTHKLNEIYEVEKRKKDTLSLFFPSGAEITSIIKGNENKANNLKYPNSLSIILNAYINQKIPKEDQNKFNQIINSLIEKQENAISEWKQLYEKQNNSLSSLIKDYELNSYSFELPKLTINKTELSVGSIWYHHILLCLDLLENQFNRSVTKFIIFIDEPESFMHPDWIKKVAIKIVEISQISNISTEFYIASHSPIFISSIINNINQPININIHENGEWKTLQKNVNQFYSANKILYEIYHVSCIEFLDELIGELKNNGYNFTRHNDLQFISDNNVLRFNKPHIIESDGNTYEHRTYISFARNYFHHPESRKDYQQFINDNGLTNIDDILDKSIENAISILKSKNKYQSFK